MTTGNMLDIGVIIVLNLLSSITCYMHYYPSGYIKTKAGKLKPESKSALFSRWAWIISSLFVGFIFIVVEIVRIAWEKITNFIKKKTPHQK